MQGKRKKMKKRERDRDRAKRETHKHTYRWLVTFQLCRKDHKEKIQLYPNKEYGMERYRENSILIKTRRKG